MYQLFFFLVSGSGYDRSNRFFALHLQPQQLTTCQPFIHPSSPPTSPIPLLSLPPRFFTPTTIIIIVLLDSTCCCCCLFTSCLSRCRQTLPSARRPGKPNAKKLPCRNHSPLPTPACIASSR
ncbi:hypothetical protein BO70DRAFT_143801 [Aspergillus heteromorphus CBS 117.55]|uniref:Uncharacterized protein n=1 Tax=Aspergillus heteromorphus CBS 117.55 TaxID=1448321 RepID=A0A317V894_9EURO|nr:uncharacterized protein BO70DRAFT_143801 [Aspergillus heteromorphus CBS 117.55]PWY70275.1 hypothetical protein BO70DRAFT_143801 [Aspergillus heteromorphus CBS 117.55]